MENQLNKVEPYFSLNGDEPRKIEEIVQLLIKLRLLEDDAEEEVKYEQKFIAKHLKQGEVKKPIHEKELGNLIVNKVEIALVEFRHIDCGTEYYDGAVICLEEPLYDRHGDLIANSQEHIQLDGIIILEVERGYEITTHFRHKNKHYDLVPLTNIIGTNEQLYHLHFWQESKIRNLNQINLRVLNNVFNFGKEFVLATQLFAVDNWLMEPKKITLNPGQKIFLSSFEIVDSSLVLGFFYIDGQMNQEYVCNLRYMNLVNQQLTDESYFQIEK